MSNFENAESLYEEIVNGANSILQLSQSNKRDLESLTRRLKLVQSSKPSNVEIIENKTVLSDLDPINDQEFLNQSLPRYGFT